MQEGLSPNLQKSRMKAKIVDENKKQAIPIAQTFNLEYGTNLQEYERVVQQTREKNTNFKDEDFSPDVISLSINKFATMPAKQKTTWENIEWKRPKDFMHSKQIQVFEQSEELDHYGHPHEAIEPNDIKQGLLGDCYFLCALSAMAEQPKLIKRLFHQKEANEEGIYAIWMNIFGQWQNIVIDDYFPVINNGPAFSRANGAELWVMLLEKAFAKAYGSYETIEGGNPAVALRDLTGAPYDNLDKDPQKSNQEMAQIFWEFVKKRDGEGYILTCYTQSTDVVEEENDVGILAGHAYSILDAQQVQDNLGNQAKIFQIRNPWGKKEWNGDWSDKSQKWTPELRQRLDVQDIDDGTFWISTFDFTRYFQGVGVCKVNDGYQYNSIQLDMSQDSQKLVKLTVTKDQHMFVVLNQKDDKFFINDKDFRYSYLRILVGKIENDRFTYIGGKFICDRETYVEDYFQAGEYIIYVEGTWCNSNSRDLVVNTYGEKDAKLEYIQGQNCDQVLTHLLKAYALDQPKTKSNFHEVSLNQQLTRYSFYHLGLYFLYYQNKTSDQLLNEKIPMKKLIGFEVALPFKQKSENDLDFEFQLPPNEELMFILKFNAVKTGSTSYQFGYQSQTVSYISNNQIKDPELIMQPFMYGQDLKTIKNQSAAQRNNLLKKNLQNRRKQFDVYTFGINEEQPVELYPIEKNLVQVVEDNTRGFIQDWNALTFTLTMAYILFAMFASMVSSFLFIDLTIFLLLTEAINKQKLIQQILRIFQSFICFSFVLQLVWLIKYQKNQNLWIQSEIFKLFLFVLSWAMLVLKFILVVCYTRLVQVYPQEQNNFFRAFNNLRYQSSPVDQMNAQYYGNNNQYQDENLLA